LTPPANYVIIIIRLNNPLDELEIEMNIEQFSKEHLSGVLDAFIRVKGGEINYEYGICANVDWNCISGYNSDDVLVCLFPLWDKFSGNINYPVPSTDIGYSSECLYNYKDNLWEGEYGALRYELLDFLIEELTKVVEKCDD
jgi:hypothetical protein